MGMLSSRKVPRNPGWKLLNMKPEVCLVSQDGQCHRVRNTVASMTQEVICPFVYTRNTVFGFGPLTTGRMFGYSSVCREE